jgi:threonine/homoserine/homoserine lactone efflux protein
VNPEASLALQTLVVSPSGALSPGPLTIATITLGARGGWKSGALVAFGHMMFELPYVVMLTVAFNTMKIFLESLKALILCTGVAIILYFAYMIFRDVFKGFRIENAKSGGKVSRSPIAVGFTFTAFNVFFLMWWISIGLSLITRIFEMGIASVIIMYPVHVWIDFAWLSLVAEASRRGTRLLSEKGYRVLMTLLGALMVLFAINILLKSFLGFAILP